MPLYIGDYLADTAHLTRDQHGGYLLLIFAYWRNGGPLPDDDARLARICKASAKQWRELREVLSEFFQIENGIWRHKRIEEEIQSSCNAYARRAAAAAKRWSKADTMHEQLQPQPHSTNVEKEISTDAPARLSAMQANWEPNAAIQQFAALKCIDPAELAEQAELFRDHYLANGHLAVDWSARFRLWLNRRHQFYRPPKTNGKTRNDAIRQALDEFNQWCDRGNETRDSAHSERDHAVLPKPSKRLIS